MNPVDKEIEQHQIELRRRDDEDRANYWWAKINNGMSRQEWRTHFLAELIGARREAEQAAYERGYRDACSDDAEGRKIMLAELNNREKQ